MLETRPGRCARFGLLLGVGLLLAGLPGGGGIDARAADTSDTRDAPSFPWTGEQFVFSLRVNEAEAMRASLKTGPLRTSQKRRYVPLGLNVQSLDFFDNVYPVDDEANTYMNPETMRPYRSEKQFREAGKSRSYVVDYRPSSYAAKVEKSRPDRTQTFERAVPATTHDMITWLYDLRRREFAVGRTFRYFVYDGWKLSHVYMTIVGREELYTPAGWFKAWKFQFVRKVLSSKRNHQGGQPVAPILKVESPSEHHGHFWLSRDENRLPLRVTIPTSFGAGEAVLIRYDRHTE